MLNTSIVIISCVLYSVRAQLEWYRARKPQHLSHNVDYHLGWGFVSSRCKNVTTVLAAMCLLMLGIVLLKDENRLKTVVVQASNVGSKDYNNRLISEIEAILSPTPAKTEWNCSLVLRLTDWFFSSISFFHVAVCYHVREELTLLIQVIINSVILVWTIM